MVYYVYPSSNLVEVCARTDPDLPSLVMLFRAISIELSKTLDHEANWNDPWT